MDPNANLDEVLRSARRLQRMIDRHDGPTGELLASNLTLQCDVERLSELVIALDEWLQGGGFVPERWQRAGCA